MKARKLKQIVFRCLLTSLAIDTHAQRVVHSLARMQGEGYPLLDGQHLAEDVQEISERLGYVRELIGEMEGELGRIDFSGRKPKALKKKSH